MIALVTLAQAKMHRRITDTDRDADIQMKLEQASAMVMGRLKYDTVPDEWIVNSSPITYDIPWKFQGYTLLILGELDEMREGSAFNIEEILKLLDQDRPPTLA